MYIIIKCSLPAHNVAITDARSVNVCDQEGVLKRLVINCLHSWRFVLEAFNHDIVEKVDHQDQDREGYRPNNVRHFHYAWSQQKS